MADVVTVRQAVQRAKNDGFPVSEYTLRMWIKTGALPVRKAGAKLLILDRNRGGDRRCADGGDIKPATVAALPGIRRINL